MAGISDLLKTGKNTIRVSNATKNRLFVYVVESHGPLREGNMGIVIGSLSDLGNGMIAIEFDVNNDWEGPIFEPLDREEKTKSFAKSMAIDLKQIAVSKNGKLFFDRISTWTKCFALRYGKGKNDVEKQRSDIISHIEGQGELCELGEFEVIISDHGILLTGKPAMKIGEWEIYDIIFTKVNGEFLVWGFR